jgi:uncharacterized protein YraI/beta-lactamase class A
LVTVTNTDTPFYIAPLASNTPLANVTYVIATSEGAAPTATNGQGVIIISATPAPNLIDLSAPTATVTPLANFPATNTSAAPASVYAEAIGTANVRYGPGEEYDRVGEIKKGEIYAVLRQHSRANWLEIAFAGVGNGRVWVFRELVKITGDINSVPVTSELEFGYPTLTPTTNKVVAGSAPGVSPDAGVAAALQVVGDALYGMMLASKFEPGTKKQGSAFLLDLNTKQSVSLNPGVAYSGVSLMKVPVAISFFRKFSNLPTTEQAQLLAEMILCSENLSSNRILAFIGDGDEYRGALYVTQTMRDLGLQDTFLTRSFFTGVPAPVGATEVPFIAPTTSADQQQTNPDPSNQTTPADMGLLLTALYQCALDGSGPLTEKFVNEIDQNDCRRVILLMRSNRIRAMFEGGVPNSVAVIHKNGWENETYGDAGIFLSENSDYVLVLMLRNETWLLQDDAFPLFAEVSRRVYNAYNPAEPLGQISNQTVPPCDIAIIRSTYPNLLADIQSVNVPAMKELP